MNEEEFDLCLTDMKLPDGDGIALVEYIQQAFPSLPTAVITAHGSIDLAIKAMKSGAFDFVSKPVSLDTGLYIVSQLCELNDATISARQNVYKGSSFIIHPRIPLSHPVQHATGL